MHIILWLALIMVLPLFIFLFIVLFKKRTSVAVTILASGLGICVVGVILSNTIFYNNSDRVTITNGNDEDFSISVDNHLLQYEYTFVQFSSDLDFDELQNAIKSHYNNAFFDNELNQFVFIDSNIIYTIEFYEHTKFLWSDRYKYMFSSNTIQIEHGSEYVNVPFPRDAVDESVGAFNAEMKLKIDYDKIKLYYNSFTNAKFGENTITLAYDNYNVNLTVLDYNVIIEISNN